MNFTLYPAIDVREQGVVRLAQGDYARETRYPTDPFELARSYAKAGAQWLHLVDLDAARLGGYTLLPLIERIKRETTLRLQTGGGVRDVADAERILGEGVDRVVVGSMAVQQRRQVAGWIERFGPDRIVVALDARRDANGAWWPATHGWTQPAQEQLATLLDFYSRSGLHHLLCTDIERDGMMRGPSLELYGLVRDRAPSLCVQASGGMRNDADIGAVQHAGCAGVVLGKALLDGCLDLSQAMRWQSSSC